MVATAKRNSTPDVATAGTPPWIARSGRACALLSAGLVLLATRSDPLLSADSITYLSGADHLRRLEGFRDWTGEPLTHFPPMMSALLVPGGRSLGWATFIGASAAGIATGLMNVLLRSRVRPSSALLGTLAFAALPILVYLGSTVWSEGPYVTLSIATLLVLGRTPLTERRAAAGGALAALGFLTRYSGAGLIAAGLAMVIVASALGRTDSTQAAKNLHWTKTVDVRRLMRTSAAYLATSGGITIAWVIRNILVSGHAFGPRFGGGAGESVPAVAERTASGTGTAVGWFNLTQSVQETVGTVALLALLGFGLVALARRTPNALDVGMVAFALMSVLVPGVGRIVQANDIDFRMMAPMFVPVLYLAVLAIDAIPARRAALTVGALFATWSLWGGINEAIDFPDRVAYSAIEPSQFSPELYRVIDELPADANVLTNSSHRVWWHTGRDPMQSAFTNSRPGLSHHPMATDETFAYACRPNTYLAWFFGLINSGTQRPAQVRPDLAELIDVTFVEQVPGGELYSLTPVDPSTCPPTE